MKPARSGRRAAQRWSAALALSALATSALVACAPSGDDGGTASGETVTIDFWGWVPGLEDLVDQWNEENEDIQVSFHRMTGDDGKKVEAAVDAGKGPDIVQVSSHNVPDYVITGRALDITEYVSQYEDDYTAASWATVSFDDRVYGIPQGIGPAATMYRTDIFAQYGLEMPATWDEFLDTARALKAATPDVKIANLSPSEMGQWIEEIHQAGSSWYGIDGDSWTVGVNDEGSRLVAERWQTLLDEDLVSTEQMWTPEYWALVNDGKIATITYAAWFPSLIAENAASTSGNWAVAPMPKNAGSDASGDSGGGGVVVLKNTKNAEAAAAFGAWLNGSDDTQDALITVGGLFPSTLNGLASDALLQPSEFFGGQAINEVFIQSAEETPDTWMDGPNFGAARTAILDEFAKVVQGQGTFLEALDTAQKVTVDDLKARGLSVSE